MTRQEDKRWNIRVSFEIYTRHVWHAKRKTPKEKLSAKFTLTNSEIIPAFTEPLCPNICTKITYKDERGIAPGQPPTAPKSKETSATLKFIRPVRRMPDKWMCFNASISPAFLSLSPFTLTLRIKRTNTDCLRRGEGNQAKSNGYCDLNNGCGSLRARTARYPRLSGGIFSQKIIGKVEHRE